ncbi:MAG: hypothetical protein IKA57_05915 [Clostridia bacterium]|nr:hypothetical protein [Clostridia bacterium]
MYKQLGKFLKIIGFGFITLYYLVYMVMYIFRTSLPADWMYHALDFIQLMGWIAVTGGFSSMFFEERNLLDIICSVLFAVLSLIYAMTMVQSLWGSCVSVLGIDVYRFIVDDLFDILIAVALVLWAVKLFRTNLLASVLIVVSIIALPIAIRIIDNFHRGFVEYYIWINFSYVAVMAVRTFVAYLEN